MKYSVPRLIQATFYNLQVSNATTVVEFKIRVTRHKAISRRNETLFELAVG